MLYRCDLVQDDSKTPQSLYGSFADLGIAPSVEDIDKVRREMWSNFSET